MGLLNIQQREQDRGAAPATNFTALRVRRDILANSDIGAVLLNKEENGSALQPRRRRRRELPLRRSSR